MLTEDRKEAGAAKLCTNGARDRDLTDLTWLGRNYYYRSLLTVNVNASGRLAIGLKRESTIRRGSTLGL